MEERLHQTGVQRDFTNLFLHYYFNSISDNAAEGLISSLVAKISSLDSDQRYVCGSHCIWFIAFITVFDQSTKKGSEKYAKMARINLMGIDIIEQLLPIR